ncbi:hypothetical protein [Hymenobacter aquaticus]|uniref:hypothetical protein n=1 Tax=Hymenobacter aquaticus TaxID=1867101 RepID=UPI0014368248|nr:hypothetical protein [Hymenobacter aquaticus]
MSFRTLLTVAVLLGSRLPTRAQKPDTTLIRYSGQLAGQYSAGGVNRALFSTSHSATLLRGLHFGAPLTGSFTFGKQEGLLKEREWLFNATPYYWKGRFRFYGIGGYERSNLRGINNRFQLGLGPGWAFYADSLGRELAVSNLFIREATYFQGGTQRRVAQLYPPEAGVFLPGVFAQRHHALPAQPAKYRRLPRHPADHAGPAL